MSGKNSVVITLSKKILLKHNIEGQNENDHGLDVLVILFCEI